MNKQTDMTKNITFQQTTYTGGIKQNIVSLIIRCIQYVITHNTINRVYLLIASEWIGRSSL